MRRGSDDTHFTDEETEVPETNSLAQGHTVDKWQDPWRGTSELNPSVCNLGFSGS